MRALTRSLTITLALLAGGAAVAQEELRFGIDPTFAPFEMKNPDGTVAGFSVDVGEAICRELGRECVWVESAWDGIIPGLAAGNYDAILSSMSITPERQALLDFTDPYQKGGSRFVVPEGQTYDDAHGGMSGVIVGVQRGTVDHDYLKAHYPDADIRAYPGQDEVWLDLAAGRIDAAFVGNVPAGTFLDTPEGAGFVQIGEIHDDPAIYGPGAGIGVRKGDDELREALNGALRAIRDSGEFKEINDRYFDFDISGGA
jgi:lysine-arginine-ornithine-binding protein